ncbi:MAG: LppX_LprAFG lipoprotein [Actinophytocola sp.]|nr:LppX_LprAFG lipoprotein [Actinophytocola sp.]
MFARRCSLAVLAALIAVLPACSGEDTEQGDSLPPARQLVENSANTAAGITSTHFAVDVNGTVPGFGVESIDGDLSMKGQDVAAKGTAVITAFGAAAEAEFVLTDGTLYLNTGGGNYQEIPESQAKLVYDFSAVLDPERGVAKLIRNLSGPTTVAEEDVNGTATYKITGTATKDDIAGLVPSAKSDVDVTLWVSKENGNQPVKAAAKFPGGGGEGGTVTVTLSDVNEPVAVAPPK